MYVKLWMTEFHEIWTLETAWFTVDYCRQRYKLNYQRTHLLVGFIGLRTGQFHASENSSMLDRVPITRYFEGVCTSRNNFTSTSSVFLVHHIWKKKKLYSKLSLSVTLVVAYIFCHTSIGIACVSNCTPSSSSPHLFNSHWRKWGKTVVRV